MKKRIISAAVSACLLLTLAIIPASAAGSDALQTVQALGIMVGDETGNMALERNVTRAEFAKMLTAASSYKDTISDQGSGYSLFKDVKSGHWASEYIKTTLDAGWMVGYTDGTFRPDNAITLEEACTAALRLLGYDSSDLTGSFPAAQLNKAASLGLRDGLARAQGEQMTRSDCATLFYNLMTAQTASGQIHATTLGYTLNSAGELDYAALVAKDLKGPYTAASGGLSLPFEPKAVYKDGASNAAAAAYDIYYYNENLKAVYLYDDKVTGVYTAASPGAASPSSVTVGGKSYAIETSQAAYKLSTAGTFSVGDVVTLLLGMDGKVADVVGADIVTAKDMDYNEIVNYGLKGPYTAGVNGQMDLPFDPSGASVYVDGVLSTAEKVKQYDIYYYNTSLKVVYAYTDRATGTYTAASPSLAAPTSVTVAGKTYSLGTSDAKYKLSTLGGCSTGDVVTLLLGMDGTVADVLTGSGVEAEYYGVVQSAEKAADPVTGSTVNTQLTVACTDGNTYTFQLSTSNSFSVGSLVTVSISGGKVTAKRLSEKTLSGSVNKAGTKLGDYDFADHVQIMDTSDSGVCVAVEPSRLAGCTLSDDHVRYYVRDENGDISHLILDDATGDTWTYGYMISASTSESGSMNVSGSYRYIMDGRETTLNTNNQSYSIQAGGLAIRYDTDGTSIKTLKNLTSVKLTDLAAYTAKAENKKYTVAEDVQVYLKQNNGYYLTDLSSVNAEDYRLTGWYDDFGAPAGGQIRVIVAAEMERQRGKMMPHD